MMYESKNMKCEKIQKNCAFIFLSYYSVPVQYRMCVENLIEENVKEVNFVDRDQMCDIRSMYVVFFNKIDYTLKTIFVDSSFSD